MTDLHRFVGFLLIAIGFITIPSGITGAVVGLNGQSVLSAAFIAIGILVLAGGRLEDIARVEAPSAFADSILHARSGYPKAPVVIDTSAILAYERAGGIDEVKELFESLKQEGVPIFVPPGVQKELVRKGDRHSDLQHLVKTYTKGKKMIHPGAAMIKAARGLIDVTEKARLYERAEPVLRRISRDELRLGREDKLILDKVKSKVAGGIYRNTQITPAVAKDLLHELRHYKSSDTDVEVLAWTLELAKSGPVTLAEMDVDFPNAVNVLGAVTHKGPVYKNIKLVEPYRR